MGNPDRNTTKSARLETRVEPDLLELVDAAARTLRQTRSAFIANTLRRESEKVMARADLTLMDAATWDRMMRSLDIADAAPRLREAMRGVPDLPTR